MRGTGEAKDPGLQRKEGFGTKDMERAFGVVSDRLEVDLTSMLCLNYCFIHDLRGRDAPRGVHEFFSGDKQRNSRRSVVKKKIVFDAYQLLNSCLVLHVSPSASTLGYL
jgi:hypothetical protein